jgi:hypothetical protein
VTIRWDQSALDRMAETFRQEAMARAKPALESAADGRFGVMELPQGFGFGEEGLEAEFGTVLSPGTPWIMRALKGVADGGH